MSHDFAKSHRIKRETSRKKPARKSGGVPSWLWLLIGTLTGGLIMFLVYLSGIAPQLPSLAQPPTQPAVQASPAAATQPPTAIEPAAPPKRTSPVFEFYTKLPEGGQAITDIPPGTQQAQNPPAANPAEATAPTSTAQPSTTTTAPIADVPAAANVQAPPAEPLDPIQQLLAQQEKDKQQTVLKTAKPPAPMTTANASGKTYLQAGVFRNRAEADKLRSRITSLGLKSSTQTTTNAAGETLQKVIVGPFTSKADQEDASIILTGNKINAFPLK
jgi:cell division protein FtsN